LTEIYVLAGVGAVLAAIVFVGAIAPTPVRGLYVAIFSSAILITPELPVVREKIAACEVIMVLTWLAMLLHSGRNRASSLPRPSVERNAVAAGAAFTAIACVSFLVNVLRKDVPWERSAVETANYVYGFLLLLTAVALVDSWQKWMRCFYAWALGAGVVSAVGVWSLIGGAPAWTRDEFTMRLSSTMKYSNQVPSYCIPVFAMLAAFAATRDLPKLVRLGCIVLVGAIPVVVLATGSRTGLLMILLCGAGITYLGLRRVWTGTIAQMLFVGISAALVVAFGVFVAVVWQERDKPYVAGKDPAIERPVKRFLQWTRGDEELDKNRSAQIASALEKFPSRPVFGTGPANFTVLYPGGEVHNSYVSVLVEEGAAGFLAFAMLHVAVLHAGWMGLRWSDTDKQRLFILCALLGFASLMLYGVTILSIRQRNFWFLCGLLAALPHAVRNTQARLVAARRAAPARLVHAQ